MQVKAEMGKGKVTVEEQYDEVFTIVPHPEEKYRVVNAGERDLFYRNDNGRFVEVSAMLGIDGTDEGLRQAGSIMIAMVGPTSMWPMIFMVPIVFTGIWKENDLKR